MSFAIQRQHSAAASSQGGAFALSSEHLHIVERLAALRRLGYLQFEGIRSMRLRSLKDWWFLIAPTVGALWAMFVYFDGKKIPDNAYPQATLPPSTSQTPSGVVAEGGVAVGGNVTRSDIRVETVPVKEK